MGHSPKRRPRFAHHVAIRFSDIIVDRLRRAAAARELRVSELVRDAVREMLNRVERRERQEPAPTVQNAAR